MNGFFLQCDDCHHRVELEGEITKEHIGTPCPVCNSNMLTEPDFKVFRRMRRFFKVLEFFGLARREPRDENDVAVIVKSVNGRPTLTEVPRG